MPTYKIPTIVSVSSLFSQFPFFELITEPNLENSHHFHIPIGTTMTPNPNSSSPYDKMNEYKGGAFPSPIIPVLGFTLGLTVPYGLMQSRVITTKSSESAVLTTLQSLGYVSFLFLAEFLIGAAARGTSTKASFSPAAAAASGQNPYAVVRANRIHQNHIESFMMLLPGALAAAGSGADPGWIKACVLSWIGFRGLYRIGYCYEENPFWRITGVAGAHTQFFICLWMWHKQGGSKI